MMTIAGTDPILFCTLQVSEPPTSHGLVISSPARVLASAAFIENTPVPFLLLQYPRLVLLLNL